MNLMIRKVLLIIFALIISVYLIAANDGDRRIPTSKANLLPNCEDPKINHHRNFLIATTLNGKISIIDAVWGQIKWSKQINSGPLFSSNIGNVMKFQNSKGEMIHILPSLDGSLYVHDKDTIKKSEFSAEKLLKSSVKLSDNILLVGGQESKLIGLNLETGDLKYHCGQDGCSNSNDSDDEFVLLRKNSQSIRAVNTLTGQEEWHFVVDDPQILKISDEPCHFSSGEDSSSRYQVKFKVLIPEGLISSLVHFSNDSMQSEIFNSWSLRLDSPIVNMWHLQHDNLTRVDLFDPDINHFDSVPSLNGGSKHPHLYIGSYQDKFYIQASPERSEANMLTYEDGTEKQAFIPLKSDKISPDGDENRKLISNTEFPFLKSDKKTSGYMVAWFSDNAKKGQGQCPVNITFEETGEGDNIIVEIVYTSLSYYWKEIVCLCLLSTAAFNTLWCILKNWWENHFNHKEETPTEERSSGENEDLNRTQYDAPQSTTDQTPSLITEPSFNSRYLQDFEQISLLGKGGFGMVFEARHKIDQRHYAVKRISVPALEEKRQRFMREIRALSTLEHVNIVRYYNAWVEEPPPGWQENQDKLQNYDITSTFNDNETTEMSKISRSVKNYHQKTPKTIPDSTDDSSDSCEFVFEADSTDIKMNGDQIDGSVVFPSLNKAKSTTTELSTTFGSMKKKSSDCRQPKRNGSNPRVFVYIQMQMCQKETLKDWLFQNMERDRKKMVDIFVQLLKAVNYVHSNNMIHRDLKPSNIFFSMDGLVKIGDFGLVTTIADDDDDRPHHTPPRKNLIKHTNRVGTHLYMSPEQIKNQPYDHKVDIYSIGIILYELLSPFRTESERIYMLQDVRRKVFPKEFVEKHGKEREIIEKLMAERPNDRPESAEILQYEMFNNIR